MAVRVKFSYEHGLDGVERPYLWLDLKAGAGPTRRVRGLFDTGLDHSLLPLEYARALELTLEDMEQATAEGSAGAIVVRRSSKPVFASLPGASKTIVPLYPLFVPDGSEAHWGRDFMAVYAIAFDERARQFSLFAQEPDQMSRLDDPAGKLVST